jgi:predicted aminopeptidase
MAAVPRSGPRPRRAALLLLLCQLAGGCSTAAYLAEQGRGQLHILRARRRIADVLADPAVAPATRDRLRLALEARDFGVRVLGLRGGDAYTRYLDTAGQPLAWSVYAAYPDALRPYLHRFPIAGAVPYLGFFARASALSERERLEAQGLDTYLAEVAGFSTLGLTADPIFSSMIEGPPERIVEVVLHEMLHGTVYRPGHSEWNESLATIVGQLGAAAFFAERRPGGAAGAPSSPALTLLPEAQARQERARRFEAFLQPLLRELEELYARPIPRDEKLALRKGIFARATEEYRALFPQRPGDRQPRAFARQPLNNAVLLAFTTYHGSLPALRRDLAAEHGDLPALIARYRRKYGLGWASYPAAGAESRAWSAARAPPITW